MAETLHIISDEKSSRPAGPSGIGGWLILVLLKLWIGAAARIAAAVTFLIALRGINFHSIATLASRPPAGLLPAATGIVVGSFGAIAGYLIARKSPKGPLLAKILLLIESGYYAMILLTLFLATGPRPVEPLPAWLQPAAYLLTAVLCAGYLFRSRRVDNTFYRRSKPAPPPAEEETDPRIARIRPFAEFKPPAEPAQTSEEHQPAPAAEVAEAALEEDGHASALPAPRIRPWAESSPARLPERRESEVQPTSHIEDAPLQPDAEQIQPAPQPQMELEPKAEELQPAAEPENLQPEPETKEAQPVLPAWMRQPEPETKEAETVEAETVRPAWMLPPKPEANEAEPVPSASNLQPETGTEESQPVLPAWMRQPEPKTQEAESVRPAWMLPPKPDAKEAEPVPPASQVQPEPETEEPQSILPAWMLRPEPETEKVQPPASQLQPEPKTEAPESILPAWMLPPEPESEELHAKPETAEQKSIHAEEVPPEPEPAEFQLWLNAVQSEQPWPVTVPPAPEPKAESQPAAPEEDFLTLKAHIADGVTEWLSSAGMNHGHAASLPETSTPGKRVRMQQKLLRQVAEICDHAYAVHQGQFPTLPNTADSHGSLSQELEKWAIAQAALRLTRALDIRAAIEANGPFENVIDDSEYLLAIVEKNSSEDSFGQKLGLAEYEGKSGPDIGSLLILQAHRDMFEAELWAHVVSLAGDPDFPDRFRAAGAKAFQDSLHYWHRHLGHIHDDHGLLKPVGV